MTAPIVEDEWTNRTTWLELFQEHKETPRHNWLNIVIEQSLTSANILSVLEPEGLSCSNDKRPDGMTITSWAQGQLLFWNATCWDTVAASNIHIAMFVLERVADMATRRKGNLLGNLTQPSLHPSRCGDHGILWGEPSFTKWHHASMQFQRTL